jgi:nucleotide-binding universal stress UspA family protein
MIKSILVPIAGVEADKSRLLAALLVARRFQAHLDVLHVQPDAMQLAASAASVSYDSGVLMGALLEQLEKDARDSFAAAKETFAAFVKSENLEIRVRPVAASDAASAAWLEGTGAAGDVVARAARLHDLVVVGRSRDARQATSGTLETALMDGGRPVLILPPAVTRGLGRTVVIAWKDSAEAARAVLAAQPFLAQADRVEVVAVSENGAGEDSEIRQSAARLVDSLAWQGITASARVVPSGDSPPDAMLAAVRDLDADLVVMGGYGHSRVREMIFGGFTRHILRGADVPVLMFH